ncbi:LpqB family beta-propeller domain-containing protein [Nocardioides sp. DS6]|uniref:LpqB family beta-propeller domain-containing protein n=1 Tax=Nocardioides eburneus TaxID=3231482 RepID=A0ABV3T449_9ACTN
MSHGRNLMTGCRRSALPRPLLGPLLAVLVLLSACGISLPESGPVHETGKVSAGHHDAGFELDPRPPTPGAIPSEIVAGFLDAMQATPLQTTTARHYLSKELASSWNPQEETITYGDKSTPHGTRKVTVDLAGANRLDRQGAWDGPVPPAQSRLAFELVREQGEWRISSAPNALVVPVSWFESRFTQASLYYFDSTGRMLVPTPVFIPRGDQFATALVRDLLRPPDRKLAGVVRTFLPTGVGEGLSVPVSADGVAQVDLTGDLGEQSKSSIRLMFAQLAWTLRQDDEIRSIRLTIDGRPVYPGAGPALVPVGGFEQYDPTGYSASDGVWALRDGVVVTYNADRKFVPVAGGWGSGSHAVRSLAVSITGDRAAAVTADGRHVLLGSLYATGTVHPTPVRGQDLLRPAWDYAGRLWLVDRTRTGAAVSYLQGGRLQRVRIPGITGHDVQTFLVSRDGTRLVAVVRDHGRTVVVASRLHADTGGRVERGGRAFAISNPAEGGSRIEGIAWHSTTSVVVLQQLSREALLQILPVDGSAAAFSAATLTVGARVVALVGSPADNAVLYVETASGRLIDFSGHARTIRGQQVSAITYVG